MFDWKSFPETTPDEYTDYLVAYLDIDAEPVVTHGWYQPQMKAWHLSDSNEDLPDAIPNTNMLNRVYAFTDMPSAPPIPKEYVEPLTVTGDYEFNEWYVKDGYVP